jgi:hypothetical protein
MHLKSFLDEIKSFTKPSSYTPLVIYPQENISLEKKVDFLFRQLLREKKRNNKNKMIFYAYHMGKLIEEAENLTKRSICLKKLTPYYRTVVVRTYYIFEHDRDSMISSLKWITLARIFKLSEKEYVEVLEAAEETTLNRLFSTELDN